MLVGESVIDINEEEVMALSCLIRAKICFIGNIFIKDGEGRREIAAVLMRAGNVFIPNTIDAEPVTSGDTSVPSQIVEIYRMWETNSKWGPIKWLCKKRGMQPHSALKNSMHTEGQWDEEMEALRENKYTFMNN